MNLSPWAGPSKEAGFSYVGVLFLVAIISVTASAGLHVGAAMNRRDNEAALLDIGKAYRSALLSYAVASPPGQRRRPSSLQELLRDPRFPYPKRHLRDLYPDPITGSQDWVVVMGADGSGIIGVHSASNGRPIQIGNFDPEIEHFSGKTSYQDWVFSLPD